MIIFESLLTTFEIRAIFYATGAVVKLDQVYNLIIITKFNQFELE